MSLLCSLFRRHINCNHEAKKYMRDNKLIIFLLIFFITISSCLAIGLWYFLRNLSMEKYIIGFINTDEDKLRSKYEGIPGGEFDKNISRYIKSSPDRKRYLLNLIRNLEFRDRHKWWLFESVYCSLPDNKDSINLCLEMLEKYYDPNYDYTKAGDKENELRESRLTTLFIGLEIADQSRLISYLKEILRNNNEFPFLKIFAIAFAPVDTDDEELINLIKSCTNSQHEHVREKALEYLTAQKGKEMNEMGTTKEME